MFSRRVRPLPDEGPDLGSADCAQLLGVLLHESLDASDMGMIGFIHFQYPELFSAHCLTSIFVKFPFIYYAFISPFKSMFKIFNVFIKYKSVNKSPLPDVIVVKRVSIG